MKLQPRSDNAETIVDGLNGGLRPTPVPAPERIGPYRLEERLGIGGMGEVFLAWDEKLQRRVAIKRIRQDIGLTPEQRERFRREAQLAARLSHPNVVQIHELVSDGPDDAIVMELIEGRTVEERLAADRLDTAEVLRLAAEIAEGLAAAHEAGLIHRDLKAANILITLAGHAKILDFGLARPVVRAPEDQGFTRQGVIMGTCHAMSPEQARGQEVDERSDLFSFGALVHEMLTGRPPFRGNDHIDSLQRVVTEDPVDPRLARPDLPAEAACLLQRLLAKDREKRPASAREVIEILERLRTAPSGSHSVTPEGGVSDFDTGGTTYRDLPAPSPEKAEGARSLAWTRRRMLLVGAAVLFVATVLFLVVSSARQREVRDEYLAALEPIRERVEDGEVRREDLVHLEKMIGTSPGFIEARVLAARIACALFSAQRNPADLERASELVQQALNRFPESPRPLSQAAWIAFASNNMEEAEANLEKLIRVAPGDPDILPLQARLAEEEGREDAAEILLVAASRKSPSWRNGYRLAAFYTEQGRIDEARVQINENLKKTPGNFLVSEQLANLELIFGNLDEAYRIYQGLNLKESDRVLGNLATVHKLQNRPELAVYFYELALSNYPTDVPTLINLAEVEWDLGQGRQAEMHVHLALAHLDKLEAKAALSPDQSLLKAQCHARLGQTRKAVEIAQALGPKIADDPMLLYQSAVVYNLAGDRAAAWGAAQAALDRGLQPHWFAGGNFEWLRELPVIRVPTDLP